MKNLYLFSGLYPFNTFGDCFLEEEVDYLQKVFDHIFVIPYRKQTPNQKELSEKFTILPPILDGKIVFIIRGLFSRTGFRLLLPEFFRLRVFLNGNRLITFIKAYTFLNNLCNRHDIREIGEKLTPTDVCYFYWGKWGNMLSVVWKDKARFVSRFHGEWDLWEESSGGCTPLRSKVANSLYMAAFVSRKGEQYFKDKYCVSNTYYAPLGSQDMGMTTKSSDGIVRVFTCSSIIPLKRVPLVFDCINKFSERHQVEWTHIGGGDGFEELKQYVLDHCGKNLKPYLLGLLEHPKVVEYYKTATIDLFMNLSTTEGVPVSIMEAISCDIPVIATNVGGTSEVVCSETGELVSENPSIEEVVNAMEVAINKKYSCRHYWESHYNSEVNYTEFARMLVKGL